MKTGEAMTKNKSDCCPACGASREIIDKTGHYWFDSFGNVMKTDKPLSFWKPCPEACTCIPECFSMEEHEAGISQIPIDELENGPPLDEEEEDEEQEKRLDMICELVCMLVVPRLSDRRITEFLETYGPFETIKTPDDFRTRVSNILTRSR